MCFSGPVDFYRIGAGNSNRYNGTFYQLKSIIRHPDFDISAIDYDIALLEVRNSPYIISITVIFQFQRNNFFLHSNAQIKGKVKFNENVKPAGIAVKEVTPGRQVNITGWGSIRVRFNLKKCSN